MKYGCSDKKFQKMCLSKSKMDKELGIDNSRKLQLRLKQIKASESLEDLSKLPQARCHQLKGKRKNQFAVDLQHPFRLVFEPHHDPTPLKEDGGIDKANITEILLLGVTDYHD